MHSRGGIGGCYAIKCVCVCAREKEREREGSSKSDEERMVGEERPIEGEREGRERWEREGERERR